MHGGPGWRNKNDYIKGWDREMVTCSNEKDKWLHKGPVWRNGYIKAGTEKWLHEGLVWKNGYMRG